MSGSRGWRRRGADPPAELTRSLASALRGSDAPKVRSGSPACCAQTVLGLLRVSRRPSAHSGVECESGEHGAGSTAFLRASILSWAGHRTEAPRTELLAARGTSSRSRMSLRSESDTSDAAAALE